MNYTPFSLNGTWEMIYCEEKYTKTQSPAKEFDIKKDEYIIKNAVPGYWEDMAEKFQLTSYFGKLKINPKYGLQQYPITGRVPDMALPNIIGNFFYRRSFICENIKSSAVIHFEGVQNSVSVWINDTFLGRHEGYSTPFEMLIPDGLLRNGENTIILSVSNHPLSGYEGELVSGLTARSANQYTGGITGDVELRVYKCPLKDTAILVSEDCRTVTVKPEMTENTSFEWVVCDGEKVLKSGNGDGELSFDASDFIKWSPENPKLYTLKITCEDATLSREFGVRRLLTDGVHFKLNNLPYFLRGICEHCYYPETIHPNHDYAFYRNVIKTVKKLGFNFIRFHTYIPDEEYMQAADELGILLQVECPNNTTVSQWEEIVKFCRRHTSVVIYCGGNELLLDDPFIKYLNKYADIVHSETDALFSPMSALRGVEYFLAETEKDIENIDEPFRHHPRRFNELSKFSDMYSSYANAFHSYNSLDNDPETIDKWSSVYNKPRVSHEICIDGTYTDLSLKDRYKDLRVGKTDMFSSIQRHLSEKGILKNAPLYFKNSSEWQRRIRKYCFESVRRSNNIAGYDFLGPIDTHWHTFGYDVGMMNEFYELKPGETIRNVLLYNSPTVLLTDLGKNTNFASGDTLAFSVFASHYGKSDLEDALLKLRLSIDGEIKECKAITPDNVKNGQVSKLHTFSLVMPDTEKPAPMKLYLTLEADGFFTENEWELYLFPKTQKVSHDNIVIASQIEADTLEKLLAEGKDVILFGGKPFETAPTTFRIGLAGRTSGNLATVVREHPALGDMPHEGFCGWQFEKMLEGGNAVCFETDDVPFNPIIEVASTHKYVIRQAALFEFNVEKGRLLVCGFDFKESDPAALWFKNQLISYAAGEKFKPNDTITVQQLRSLINAKVRKATENTNLAFNLNDETAVRKNQKN
ncbi:MAG: beta galactosidase jelly roll domain-containing protein, partial [Clostridia bacterium]|nr:beta galactosidase jelly roll domain-containing protein [Clostridia bacterium]